jgi:MFS family permease
MDRFPEMPSAFAYSEFRVFQLSRFLSMIAAQMLSVAVGWQVYAETHRPLDLGYVGLAQFVPAIGLSLVTGHVADRFDRRRVAMICNAVQIAASLGLFALARSTAPVVAIYAVLLVIGTARAFASPAAQALLPHLVPPEQFGNAVAWSSSIWSVGMIVGPAAGGLVYGVLEAAAPVYAACAVTYACALALLASMRVRTGRMEKRGTSWATVLAGIDYVWRNKIVLGAISLDLFAVLLGGAVALLPMFARDILDVGPRGLGMLRSAPAIGAAAMAVFLAYRPLKRRAGPMMFACVAIFGVATIVFGVSRSFMVSLVALLLIGASDMVSVFVRQQLVLLATPEEMRGRVTAVNAVFIGASNELGEFESGVTAQWLGAVRAVVVGGVGTLVVVAMWCGLFPALRKVDRLGTPSTPTK